MTINSEPSEPQKSEETPVSSDATLRVKNRRSLVKLLFLVAGFFGLAYAMIPLYDVMCKALGIGEGRTPILSSVSSNTEPQKKMAMTDSSMSSMKKDMDHGEMNRSSSLTKSENAFADMTPEQIQEALNRDIRVVFSDAVTDELPWEVVPTQSEITVKPGKTYTIIYRAKNISNREISGQAIPSYSPPQSGEFLQKIECFCFNLQTLKPKETKDMAVTFTILPNLPKDIAIVTLHYRFIKVKASG